MKRLVKSYLKEVAYYVFRAIGVTLTMLRGGVKISDNACKKTFEDAGYVFKPLWGELEPLKPNSLDLSIIIPVYNSENYLRKCLDTILNQKTTYRYEVICVNDGCTDSSPRILEEYAAKYKHLRILNQQNQGISAARNRGIAIAAGELIGFIDNDDYVTSDYVQKLMDRQRQTDADIVQCAHMTIDIKNGYKQIESKGDVVAEATEPEKRLQTMSGYIWGGVMRKSIFTEIRFPMGFWFEDMITRFLVMRLAGRISSVGEPLYMHTFNSTNASRTLWKQGDIHALDQYWLAYLISELAETKFGIMPDNTLIELLIYEWSPMLLSRTCRLPDNLRKAMFHLCCNYIERKGLDNYVTSDSMNRDVAKAFKKRSYKGWECLSRAYLCRRK